MKASALFLCVLLLVAIPAYGHMEGEYYSDEVPGTLVFSSGNQVTWKHPGEADRIGTYERADDKLIINLDGAEEFLIDSEGNFSVTIFEKTISYKKLTK